VAKVEIYLTDWCAYSFRTKAVLDAKGVQYDEYDIEADPARNQEMHERAGADAKVPVIFINDKLIGGSDELGALEDSGELDRLLAENG